MCEDCGCGEAVAHAHGHAHEHPHAHPNDHNHPHDHEHPHHHEHEHEHTSRTRTVQLERKVLSRNDELAAQNRAWLEERRNWLKTLEPLLLARERGWQADVMAAYEARLRDRTPDYRSVFDHNLQTIAGAYARVLSMMDERQRNRAREELDRMRQTLLKLMARPGNARRGTTPCAPCYASQINGPLRPGEPRFFR